MDVKARLANYTSQIKAKIEQANKLAEDDNFSPVEMKGLTDEIAVLKERFEAVKALDPANALWLPGATGDPAEQIGEGAREKADAVKALRSGAGLKSKFSGATRTEQALKAYRFAKWFQGNVLGNAKAKAWCEERGIKAMSEGSNADGGALVPDEFVNDLILLREQYGKFRQYARVRPMGSDVSTRPRRTGGITTYYVGENAAITAASPTFDNVSLIAKKLAALTYVSSEFNEDTLVDAGNTLIDEIAYAFALAEDTAGFVGTSLASQGGITGVTARLKGLSSTYADIAGVKVATDNLISELDLVDYQALVGILPEFADTPNARWFVHRSVFYNSMVTLAQAAGGTTSTELINGVRTPMFLGYPVVFSQVMPKTDANSQVVALLGDLAMAADLGDRRQINIQTDNSVGFASDQIAVRGTQRYDINVHDVGNATATAADKQAGPIVGLMTAAS